jgi:hypothetical protein
MTTSFDSMEARVESNPLAVLKRRKLLVFQYVKNGKYGT